MIRLLKSLHPVLVFLRVELLPSGVCRIQENLSICSTEGRERLKTVEFFIVEYSGYTSLNAMFFSFIKYWTLHTAYFKQNGLLYKTKGGFAVMTEVTHILAANTRRQFFFN